MKQTFAVIILSLLVLLSGCGEGEKSPAQPDASPVNTFIIDYAHESGGVFYHGTLSMVGDKVKITWTVDDGSNKKSRNVSMTTETFSGIWDAFNDISDFNAGFVKDPNQQLDPKTYHVVGIVFSVEGQTGKRTYMIPAEGASPAFKKWLIKIGHPAK